LLFLTVCFKISNVNFTKIYFFLKKKFDQCWFAFFFSNNVRNKVFKPGPVQGPGSGFWPGRPGQFLFLKNSKRRHFSKKTKVNELQPGFLPGFAGSTGSLGQPGHHQVMAYAIFSSTRPGSSPGPTSRADPPGQTGFQNMVRKEIYPQFEVCF